MFQTLHKEALAQALPERVEAKAMEFLNSVDEADFTLANVDLICRGLASAVSVAIRIYGGKASKASFQTTTMLYGVPIEIKGSLPSIQNLLTKALQKNVLNKVLAQMPGSVLFDEGHLESSFPCLPPAGAAEGESGLPAWSKDLNAAREIVKAVLKTTYRPSGSLVCSAVEKQSQYFASEDPSFLKLDGQFFLNLQSKKRERVRKMVKDVIHAAASAPVASLEECLSSLRRLANSDSVHFLEEKKFVSEVVLFGEGVSGSYIAKPLENVLAKDVAKDFVALVAGEGLAEILRAEIEAGEATEETLQNYLSLSWVAGYDVGDSLADALTAYGQAYGSHPRIRENGNQPVGLDPNEDTMVLRGEEEYVQPRLDDFLGMFGVQG